MPNHFSAITSAKTEGELNYIIQNKEKYQEDLYAAAIEELEKREQMASELLPKSTVNHDEQVSVKSEGDDILDEGKPKKRGFKEIILLLRPTRDHVITPILVYLNIFVFVLMVIGGVNPITPSVESLIQWGGNLRSLTLDGQLWRLLTSTFLHIGIFHLILNIYALLYIGDLVEKEIGRNRYLLIYLLTGIFASIASVSFNENVVSVGASGAIFGIYGLFLAMLVTKQVQIEKEYQKSLLNSVLIFVGYNLFFGFTRGGVDNAGHVGGLISGLLIGFMYSPLLKNKLPVKYISTGITAIALVMVLILPGIIPNQYGEFQRAMEKFSANEEKALWMYEEDLSMVSEYMVEEYDRRLEEEGVELWNENLEILNSLDDLPLELRTRVRLLSEYCELRIEICRSIQMLLKFGKTADKDRLENLYSKIEDVISELKKLNGVDNA